MKSKNKIKKPFYKQWWFILIVIVFIISGINDLFDNQTETELVSEYTENILLTADDFRTTTEENITEAPTTTAATIIVEPVTPAPSPEPTEITTTLEPQNEDIELITMNTTAEEYAEENITEAPTTTVAMIIVEPVTPAPSPEPTKPPTIPVVTPNNELSLVAITSPVARNEHATVTVRGLPNTEYTIDVHYPSGVSTADGLEKKKSDADGIVSWTWHIGGRTSQRNHYLIIQGSGASLRVDFTVN